MIISINNLGLEKATQLRLPLLIFKALFRKNFDEDYFTFCIFSDLSKAFNTVNHKILINKINSYGIQGKMHSLLSYYLTNHNQYTQCNDIKSKVNSIYSGVAQGSTLEPLFFPCILMIYFYILNFATVYFCK